MSQEASDQKSLVEQIYRKMFSNLEESKKFDVETLGKLKQLFSSKEKIKSELIEEIIKNMDSEKNAVD